MVEFLYHVTQVRNLESIAEHGLRSGGSSSFGGGYEGHARGRLFLAERGGVRCWWGKIEALVEDHNEGRDILPGLAVPVVLRIESFHFKKLVDDPLGSRDCPGGRSYYSEGKIIGPRAIEVWNGRQWESLPDVDPEAVMMAYVKSVKIMDEDGNVMRTDEEPEDGWTEVELRLPGAWPY